MNVVLREQPLLSEAGQTLDPQNWDELRALGHRMLDDMLDYAADDPRPSGLVTDTATCPRPIPRRTAAPAERS